jgi:hypothetical protein
MNIVKIDGKRMAKLGVSGRPAIGPRKPERDFTAEARRRGEGKINNNLCMWGATRL